MRGFSVNCLMMAWSLMGGATGARDAEASGPGSPAPPDDDDVPEFHLIVGQMQSARCALRQRRMRAEVAAAIRRRWEVPGLTWTCQVAIARPPLAHTAEPSLDADRRSLEELDLNLTSRGRSVLLYWAPFLKVRNVSWQATCPYWHTLGRSIIWERSARCAAASFQAREPTKPFMTTMSSLVWSSPSQT